MPSSRRSPQPPKRSSKRSPAQSPRTTIRQYKEYRGHLEEAVKAVDLWVNRNHGRLDFNAFMDKLPEEFKDLHRELYHRELTFGDIMNMARAL